MKKLSVGRDLKNNKNSKAAESALMCIRAKEAINKVLPSLLGSDYIIASFNNGILKIHTKNVYVSQELVTHQAQWRSIIFQKTGISVVTVQYKNFTNPDSVYLPVNEK